jgi:hypothetical protein
MTVLRSTGDPIPQYQKRGLPDNFEAATGINGGIDTNIIAPIPAGAAVMGKVGIDQTVGQNIVKDADVGKEATGIVIPVGGLGKIGWLSGIYDSLSKVILAAGTAIIGKVGIDQTTPGTTNGVVVNSSALPTGASTSTNQATLIAKDFATQTTLAAILAKVIAAPATEATLALIKSTDGIKKITDALPAGTNNIGDVDVLTLPATNVEGTALASAARTVTISSADIINSWGKGIQIIFDVTAVATSDVKVKVEGKDPASGKYYTILESASVVAITTNVYRVYPGLIAAANLIASDILPKTIRFTVTHANANSTTYSVGYSLV